MKSVAGGGCCKGRRKNKKEWAATVKLTEIPGEEVAAEFQDTEEIKAAIDNLAMLGNL